MIIENHLLIGKVECNGYRDVIMRLSKNSRCVIVMTNLAFAPVGRKRVGTVNRVFDV
jgi:hypothetical protein